MALKRVNTKTPCQICGKTSWCGYNESIIVCSRVTEGAARLSRSGGGVFPQGETPIKTPSLSSTPPPSSINYDLTHQVFTTLLTLSPPSPTQATELESRGLSPTNFWRLPGKESGRFRLAKQLNSRIPLSAGVPGLRQTINGWTIGWPSDMPDAIGIPIRGRDNQISACQVRFPSLYKDMRYRWLSTPNFEGGAGSGTPVHYIWPSDPTRLLLTEGPLKAETLHTIYPDDCIAAIAGIGNNHEEILNTAGNLELIICFDQDTVDSPGWLEVQFHTFKLLEKRLQSGLLDKTFVAKWTSPHKGIDDAARGGVEIRKTPGRNAHNQLSQIDFSLRRNRFPHRSK